MDALPVTKKRLLDMKHALVTRLGTRHASAEVLLIVGRIGSRNLSKQVHNTVGLPRTEFTQGVNPELSESTVLKSLGSGLAALHQFA